MSEEKEEPIKRGRGRPSKYEASHCDKVLEMGEYGASYAEMCLELSICKQTFLNWQDEHPEFLDAVMRAKHLSQGWWERKGRESCFSDQKYFSSAGYSFQMQNRFPEDWELKSKVTVSTGDAERLTEAKKRKRELAKERESNENNAD